ncbi:MAG TPA: hypothetical protein VGM31_01400 [Puia sp.]|jgi:hypothetical protein
MRWLLVILLCGVGCIGQAQDLTGQWTGDVTSSLSDQRQKLVLTITSADSSFAGVLHWYFPESHFIRHLVISGRYYAHDSILTVREDSVTLNRPEGGRDNIIIAGLPAEQVPRDAVQLQKLMGRPLGGFYVLYYKRINHKDILVGHWQTTVANSAEKLPELSIRLEKKAPPFIPVVIAVHKKKDATQQKQFDAFLSRSSVTAAKIPVKGIDSIRIDLYDNGEIDGDSVSLYLNNELLLSHLRLTAQAKTLIIPIDKSLPVNKLVLFAENLGKLPPNTALMEVTVHGRTYNLFLSTDYKRNATVEFNLEE